MGHPTQSISRNLPVGWRFNPTDVELLLHYLMLKLLGDPIDGSDIQEFNICNRNPHDLFGDFNSSCGDEVRYVFSPREYNQNNQRKRKVKDGGSWKITGDPRLIMLGNTQIGSKRSVTYSNNGVTEITSTEYSYTAPLDRPIVDDCVIYKLERKAMYKKPVCNKSVEVATDCEEANPKKRGRNFKMEVEPDCKKTGPKKKGRKGNLMNCKSGSALVSSFRNEDAKNMIANPANGEGEQSNHMACDLDDKCPNIMPAMSTYVEGKSSYPENSYFDSDQNLFGTGSALTFNKVAATTVMNSHNENCNSDRIATVSTNENGDLESVAEDKMDDMPSYVENQSSCEMGSFSLPYKDEKSSLMDDDFLNQYLNYALDSGFQNPGMSMDISASVASNWSTQPMPSDFEKQNQNEKTDMSFPEDDGHPPSTSEVYNNNLKKIEIYNKKIDLPIGDTYSKIEDVQSQYSNIRNFLEVDSNLSGVDPQELKDKMAELMSDLQQPTHTNEIPQFQGETNMAALEDNHSQVTACDAKESATGILRTGNASGGNEQWLEEVFGIFELHADLNSPQQPHNTHENAKLSSFGSLST